eukprot:sb/3475497/
MLNNRGHALKSKYNISFSDSDQTPTGSTVSRKRPLPRPGFTPQSNGGQNTSSNNKTPASRLLNNSSFNKTPVSRLANSSRTPGSKYTPGGGRRTPGTRDVSTSVALPDTTVVGEVSVSLCYLFADL